MVGALSETSGHNTHNAGDAMSIRKTMIIARQAGKVIAIGTMTGAEIVHALRSGQIRVNPQAQRSLVKGAAKDTTAELLDNDRVETTPRMKSFMRFADRLMEELKKGRNTEGFLGCIQLVVPEAYKGARLVFADAPGARGASYEVQTAFNALGTTKLAVFEANPAFDEAVLHLGDGQGRCFLPHSLERATKKKIMQVQKAIRKKEKAHEPVAEEKANLAALEAKLKDIQSFLTDLHLGVMFYADSVDGEGRVKGLPVDAEQRLYIEGNALNSQASQEEVLKYEQYSPIVTVLRSVREDFTWMSQDYIEEDSKTISASSTRVFTLSALVQAFSLSLINDNQPLKKFDEELADTIGGRVSFVEAFWSRVTEVFGRTWVPDPNQKPGERQQYLESVRGAGRRNVAFQALFLLALGRLGYEMGEVANWDPDHDVLAKLDRLNPATTEYDAARTVVKDSKPAVEWEPRWTNTMMKQSLNDDGEVTGHTFNNSRENLEATYRLLAKLADFTPKARAGRSGPPEIAPELMAAA